MKQIYYLQFVFFIAFLLLLLTSCFMPSVVEAQNIGINTTGAIPNASAGLDIDFTTKGLLIPRLTTAQRNAINTPATALQIYNLDCNEFQYYNGSNWISMINSGSLSAPSSSAATSIIQTSFNANWAAVSGATTYYLDVATDFSFTSFVAGYNNLNVGNVVTYSVSGLTCNTLYYYRARANNSCGTSANSNTITVTTSVCCTNAWTQKLDFGGTARWEATGFSIGTKGYIGTGYNGSYFKDFWEYDPGTNVWTQKADFPGTARHAAVGFSIGTKGYIGTGYDGGGNKTFYEYDPITNTWSPKATYPGSGGWAGFGFSIGSKGYIGCGSDGSTNYKDFWEYDPVADNWTSKAIYPGAGGTHSGFGFSIGTKGYAGMGESTAGGPHQQDFWEYDQGTDSWVSKANFGGGVRYRAAGFSIGSLGYVGTGNQSGTNKNDFWEYNPGTDTWTAKTNYGGAPGGWGVGFSIGTNGYIGTGNPATKDFWEYCP